jgi:hypothetical protein
MTIPTAPLSLCRSTRVTAWVKRGSPISGDATSNCPASELPSAIGTVLGGAIATSNAKSAIVIERIRTPLATSDPRKKTSKHMTDLGIS